MHLLYAIERYLQRTNTPPSRFGREAVGDPRLVHDLRLGREPRAATVARIINHMAASEAGNDDA